MMLWESGQLTLATEHELRGRMLALREASDVNFDMIEGFYRREAENEPAPEGAEQGTAEA